MLASGLWVAGGRPSTELMFHSVASQCVMAQHLPGGPASALQRNRD